MKNILQIQAIQKSYGPVKALRGVSFAIPEKTVFGILGPNGSGKTTMLGILLQVLIADAGSFQWLGYANNEDARKRIGALLETPNFFHYLSAEENLRIVAQIKGRGEENIDKVLDRVGLLSRKTSAFKTFSLGMKQRLAIASALLADPEVLVLDEPTNGLDPVGITEIRNLILELQQEGITIIMASHLLDEVEKVCTHVAILKQGELLTSGAVTDVLVDEEIIEVNAASTEALLSCLKQCPAITDIKTGPSILLRMKEGTSLQDINAYCHAQGIVLNHLVKRKRSLESKFMEITS
jgi:ABC-2 type transport system ATP-binding protein